MEIQTLFEEFLLNLQKKYQIQEDLKKLYRTDYLKLPASPCPSPCPSTCPYKIHQGKPTERVCGKSLQKGHLYCCVHKKQEEKKEKQEVKKEEQEKPIEKEEKKEEESIEKEEQEEKKAEEPVEEQIEKKETCSYRIHSGRPNEMPCGKSVQEGHLYCPLHKKYEQKVLSVEFRKVNSEEKDLIDRCIDHLLEITS